MEKIKLVFATNNENKLREIKSMLGDDFNLLSLKDINCFEDIPETCDTIEGNAKQKANYVSKTYKHNCFADDTGLVVDALDGEPGVYSARYAGPQRNAEDNNRKLLMELKSKEDRSARFKTVIALNLGNKQYLFTGICKGHIISEYRGKDGFGYDPIFKPQGSNLTFAEMTLAEKNKIGHRGKATRKLIDHLLKIKL